MATVAKKVGSKKPERFVRLLYPITGEVAGIIRIKLVHASGRTEVDDYEASRVGSNHGDGFRLQKPADEGGEVYTVELADHGCRCNCPAGRRDVPCKHVGALATLREKGLV